MTPARGAVESGRRSAMSRVLLVYPFFRRFPDLTIFRRPPLGIAYVAAALRGAGHDVRLLDCTFMRRPEALHAALTAGCDIAGIYCMESMLEDCLWLARELREACRLLIAGGPLPTSDPGLFLETFDVVVRGEGERTAAELLAAWEGKQDLRLVPGLALRDGNGLELTPDRPFETDLDAIPFPARDLLPNGKYIGFGKRRFGHSLTSVMSTRGCPFSCEFCSNVIFGRSYRERSAGNLVDEIETVLAAGYERVAFADDVFTMNRRRVLQVCDEIRRRRLTFPWECLARVDSIDAEIAREMKRSGCWRIFFGIESGSNGILRLMNKRFTADQAAKAVETAHAAGIQVGAFFILFYPGDTDDTVLETLRFASSLPLSYLGLSMPYPLPGTALRERVKDRNPRRWKPAEAGLQDHVLTFDADFSQTKMRLGMLKGNLQFQVRRHLGVLAPTVLSLIERPTDALLRLVR